jgi:AraC-like DNA-binding protein
MTIAAGRWEPARPSRRPPGAALARERLVAERVIGYIEQNYTRRISLRDVASTMGYSPGHLTTTFRRVTGMPVTAWIIGRRVVAARDLLAGGATSVAAACELTGFADLCYFTRQFARRVGVTPGRFRQVARSDDGEGLFYGALLVPGAADSQ